jgi:phenylpyruvate tautomerase PptA (4-oxalocrotonate tautomerase family)
MTLLQPGVWLYKDDRDGVPEFAPGDPDGSKTVAGLAFQADVQVRLRDIEVQQEAKRQHRRKSLQALGEHGWGFSDLRQAYVELEDQPQQPDIGQWRRILSRDEALLHGSDEGDGHGVLYSRKVNLIFGPSESGKSMFAFSIAAQEIQAGRHVIIVDFEDDHYGFVGRLKDLGVDIEEMDPNGTKPGGAYYVPARLGMEEDDFQLLRERIEAHKGSGERVSLVLIDAVTEAMSADGLNPDKAVEVAQWVAAMPKRFASLGPGVAVIDHTGLADTDRAQGSQHKKSMVDGVALKVARKQAFIRNRGGAASISIAKDRIGAVREQSLAAKTGEMEYRGTFVMNAPGGERDEPFAMIGRNPLDLDRPAEDDNDSRATEADVDEVIEEVLRVVAENPGAGKDAVRVRMQSEAGSTKKYAAIDEAIRLRLIRVEKGSRGKIECFPILPEEQLSVDDLTPPDHEKTG